MNELAIADSVLTVHGATIMPRVRNEPLATEVRGNVDNYLHEAAQASKPPSGTVYDPDGSGRLASLGTHEHWNNATERKYSRNLGRKEGIELITAG